MRRNRLEIISDILKSAKKETLKTPILNHVNLSFRQLEVYLDFLLEANLLKSYKQGEQLFFKTSEKGFNFLNAYDEIQNLFSIQCSECGICCHDTMMELSRDDIERLTKNGYLLEDFAIINGGGASLRNVNGYCYFFNHSEKKCKVYESKPIGCTIYPVVYVEKKGARVDKLCPRGYMITEQEFRTKEKMLYELLKKIENEGAYYQKGHRFSCSPQMGSIQRRH